MSNLVHKINPNNKVGKVEIKEKIYQKKWVNLNQVTNLNHKINLNNKANKVAIKVKEHHIAVD